MRVIVTGSERGIGKAIARELCRRGHYYYGFSRCNDIAVSDYAAVRQAFEELEDDPPEALINNAGIVEMGSVWSDSGAMASAIRYQSGWGILLHSRICPDSEGSWRQNHQYRFHGWSRPETWEKCIRC